MMRVVSCLELQLELVMELVKQLVKQLVKDLQDLGLVCEVVVGLKRT
jgi:hypothetical protein